MTRFVVILILGSLILLSLVPACGTRQTMHPGFLFPMECRIIPAPTEGSDTVTVALLDPIEPERAPWARNRSERLLFHHLYETLITIDCTGSVRAGLARSWRKRDGGRRWEFALRNEIRFWDGTPVTADDVVRSWIEFALEPAEISSVIDSVIAEDEQTLQVFLAKPQSDIPRALASLAFAVMKEPDDSPWPIGSGPYEIVSAVRSGPAASGRTITLHATSGMHPSVIRFLESPVRDARDSMRSDVDLMITDDPAVLEYARRRPQLETTPLPWEWSYVLVALSRVGQSTRSESLPQPSSQFLDEIARDAVRSDARGHRGRAWWIDSELRRELAAAPPDGYPRRKCIIISPPWRRIVYNRLDRTARELAERIVALATVTEPGSPQSAQLSAAIPELVSEKEPLTAEGVTAEELESSIRVGSDFACIVKLPLRPTDPRREGWRLPPHAFWLIGAEQDISAALVPLVDTRAHLIARRDRFGAIIDWFGNTLIINSTPEEGEGE